LIKVFGLSKAYGSVQALQKVSFHVKAGEVVGLLGPNGAGKTTLMKILTGFLQPDAGRVLIDDRDILTDTIAVQQRIGYLPENAPLYPELSVQAYLRMVADLRQVPKGDQPLLLSNAIRATSLEHMLTRPIGQLSKGYRQRVGLAATILHEPKVLILDEATIGLDPTQIVEVRSLITRLSERTTVLISTHILSEVEAICDRVVVLLNGQVRADARLDELDSSSTAVLILEDGEPDVTRELESLDGVRTVDRTRSDDGIVYRVTASDRTDLRRAIYDRVRRRGWQLRELRRDVRTLEATFTDLVATTSDDAADADAEEAA
jgi:ABC-2 type transport system ATP-binding protein